ncbi:hypothetical protein BR141012304_10052 [Brucella inopinata]|nr:hypothetical protein BR141012304_10052 [Brucella inopinata]
MPIHLGRFVSWLQMASIFGNQRYQIETRRLYRKRSNRFGESIVVTIASASDRRLNARLRQPFGMMNQPAAVDGPPTTNAASEGIDHERDVNEALPSGHIRKIRKPEHVWRRCMEVPVYPVERAWRGLVRHGGFDGLAANDALQSNVPHKSSNRAAGRCHTLPVATAAGPCTRHRPGSSH